MVDLNITLPEHFLEEEIRCEYTISSEMKKVWAVELDLLHQLLTVCKKHDITIYASGGTMLGAVRHQGFIPWDDDIDMMMPRADYRKLCEVAKDEFQHPYFFQTEDTDPGSIRGHAQLRNSETLGAMRFEFESRFPINQGIFIDIFPLDNVIADKSKFAEQAARAIRYRKRASQLSSITNRYDPRKENGSTQGKVKKILHKCFGSSKFLLDLQKSYYDKFEAECQRYNDVDTEMFSTLSFIFDEPQHFKYKADYQEIIEVPFEFMQIPIGKNYDHALQTRYGNYKDFVRGANCHGNVIFDVDHSYKTLISDAHRS